jgi:uncharacterized protein
MFIANSTNDQLVVTPELFAIPDENRFIVYAPLKGVVVSANEAAVQWLARYQVHADKTSQPTLYQRFADLGLLEPPGTTRIPSLPMDGSFQPTDVIILTTTFCNFRCVYCYASAGMRHEHFKPEVARAAIRLAVGNAITQGKPVTNLAFHGGGEPTTALSFIKQCVAYAREMAAGQVEVWPSIVTNGYLNGRQIEWLAQNMHSIQVSLDGPPAIHNEQRPLANGRATFDRVCHTIQQLEQAGVPNLIIKATISSRHVQDMPAIAEFFCKTFTTRRFHFGPLMEAGRSLETGYHEPTATEYVAYAEESQQVARSYGREIVVSLAQNTFPKLRLAFCGFTDPNFAVTVEGRVTGCYEILYADDARARHAHFGEYLPERDIFVFDETRVRTMRRRLIPTLERCKNCFAKWQCGGDCHMRLFDQQTGDETVRQLDFRCQVNRELVRRQLIRAIDQHDSVVRFAPDLATDHAVV